jgi:tetratricopeptide (TPR) repeat protein
MPTQKFEFKSASRSGISLAAGSAVPRVNKIVFTGEIFQTDFKGKPTLAGEVRWFANLLGYSISLACPHLPQQVLAWEPGGAGLFNGGRFYALNGGSPGVKDWAALVDAESIAEPAAEYLTSLFRDSLVIGYGMSHVMLKFLNESGIPYVDFVLHAARFLDDIFYGIRSNVREAYDTLARFRYPEQMIHLQGRIHRASLLRNPVIDIPPDSGLFAAQSGIDKALVAEGRFTTIEDYREQISEFFSRHQYVYVKPHPYAREGSRLIAYLRSLAGDSDRVRLIRDNAYLLMVQPNISEVCGISSCVLYEAAYFGTPAVHMSPNRMDFGERGDTSFDPWRFVPIYDEFFNPHFWSQVFAGICETEPAPDLQLPRKTNRLRNNLHIYWGYGYLDFEVPLRGMGIHPPPPPADTTSAGQNHAEGGRLLREKKWEEATNSFAAAVVKEETAQRWNDWASARLALGHKQEAIDGFRLALRREPANVMALSQLKTLLP